MTQRFAEHPLRHDLIAEVHARPFAELRPPERVAYFAMLSGEKGAEADHRHVAELFNRFDQPKPAAGSKHAIGDFGGFRLKWERHTEFSSYMFMVRGASHGLPFSSPASLAVPADWLAALPGQLMVGLKVEVLAAQAEEISPGNLARLFSVENFAGGAVSGGAALAWMDFAADTEGYGRVLVHDRGLRPRQAGRIVQRLCEIETYRVIALLALPLARSHGPELSRVEERLTEIATRIGGIKQLEDERRLLQELTELSANVERIAVATNYRFGAARAYYGLVRMRGEQLRTTRVEGYQTFVEFMDRRLAPAMQTCESVAERIELLSERIARAGQLLRTRVDIELEAQNQKVLLSMDRRAQLQLRLQQTVEGLSAVAISYYLVGLISYLAKAVKSRGLAVDPDLVSGIAVPLVLALVWLGVRRIRRHVGKANVGSAG